MLPGCEVSRGVGQQVHFEEQMKIKSRLDTVLLGTPTVMCQTGTAIVLRHQISRRFRANHGPTLTCPLFAWARQDCSASFPHRRQHTLSEFFESRSQLANRSGRAFSDLRAI